MTLVGALRQRVMSRELEERERAYAVEVSADERRKIQLELLNVEWRRIIDDVPFYRQLHEKGQLPGRFASLEQFIKAVPATTRETLQSERVERTSGRQKPDFQRMTGGSTAAPVQVPAWRSEIRHIRPEVWIGRGWYGITPASRLFLLWGHSHLLGSGVGGWFNARKRGLSDGLLGYHRFSAYDLRPEALRRAAGELLRFRPDYVIGYSVALDQLARVNEASAAELRSIGVKVVVGTAESFPSPDSASRLGELFACPVAMEYGAVEAGLLAHTHPGGGYRTFWRSYVLEAERGDDGRYLLRVSSLYPRCFPLVRYEIGDEIEPLETDDRLLIGLDRFRRVLGRCNDYLALDDGARIHSELFSHALRPVSEIRGFQVVQAPQGLRIRYVAAEPLAPERVDEILGRLGKVHRQLEQAELEQVSELERTVAGKTRMVVVASGES